MLKKVTVTIEHEDCWTEEIPYQSITLGLSVYPDKNYLRSKLIVRSTSKNIFAMMKRNKNVIRINKFRQVENSTFIDFYNIYKGSIAGYLYDNEVIILGNENKEKNETWVFLTYEDQVREIVNSLKDFGKVKKVVESGFNLLTNPDLTEIERRVLLTAYTHGYFNYPRRKMQMKFQNFYP